MNVYDVTVMENPCSSKLIGMSLIFSLFFISLGLMVFEDNLVHISGSIFILFMAVYYLLSNLYVDIYHRPVSIEFNEEGLYLRFRWSEPRQIYWNEIEYVHAPDNYDEGSIRVKDEGWLYWIKTSIGEEIRRRYYVANGRFPYTIAEYWDAQPDGWRKFWYRPRGKAPTPSIKDDILSMAVDEKKK